MRRTLGHVSAAPPERPPARPPRPRAAAAVPGGNPVAHTPLPVATRAPREHRVGKVPQPRRPRRSDGVRYERLNDLFALFPELPGAARPRAPRNAPLRSILRPMGTSREQRIEQLSRSRGGKVSRLGGSGVPRAVLWPRPPRRA